MLRKFIHFWIQAHLLQSILMSLSLCKINPTSKPSQAAWNTYSQALHRREFHKHTILIMVLIYNCIIIFTTLCTLMFINIH